MPNVRRRVWLGGWLSVGAFGVSVACGVYGEEPATGESEGGTVPPDAPAMVGPTADAADATVDGPRGVCPAARYPSAAPALERPQRPLYVPTASAGEVYPFAITTDDDWVYWLEQRASADASNPYDGNGVARVLRVSRTGTAATDAAAFELASSQRYAMGLALDGDFLYWATTTPNMLRRVRRDCKTAPCMVEAVAMLPERIFRLASTREGRGVLFAVGENTAFRIQVGGPTGASVVALGAPGPFGALTLTSAHVYWTGGTTPAIGRADLGALDVVPEFLRLDGDGGLGVLTTDCTRLWGIRATDLVRVELDGAAAAATSVLSPFDVVTDERYAYVGAANGQGLHVYDKQTGQAALLAAGSTWRLATDDVGTYWGEHSRQSPNAGTLTMLVK